MRILRSIRSVNPAGGGPIEGIKQVAKVHAATGHTTEIISLDSPDDPWVQECPVPVHALGPVRSGYGYSRAFAPWIAAHRKDYDAVIVSGLWQYSGFGVWRALRGKDTPYFVFPHGMLDPWFKRAYPLKHLKKWLYWPWADYRVLRDARAVLFTSEEERRAARESFWLYRCNEIVVAYGVAAPPENGDAAQQAVLDRFPELRGKRVFLFLSRIHEKKGCDLLLRAFAKVAAANGEIRLVFAGPDQTGWARGLKALADALNISGKVLWTGMLSGDLKWGMLRLAETFVLPSHQENFGIAVAEALACGTPVLISNKVNIWREVADDDAGLVDDDDEPGTARLLGKWLALPAERRNAMRANARECFQSRFEVARAADAIVQVVTQGKYSAHA
jgi:glycosyltransferase involved in cell wall biosynthesis